MDINHTLLKMRLSGDKRLKLYRKLAKYIRNGVAVPKALEMLIEFESEDGTKPNKGLAPILSTWKREIENGEKFGAVVRRWLPSSDAVTIASGEAAGQLAIAFDSAVLLHISGKKIRGAIKGGLAYPVVLLSMAIAFMYVAAYKIIPAFAADFPVERWVGAGRNLYYISYFTTNYMHYFLVALIAFCIAVFASFPRLKGPIRVKLDRYPPFSMYRLTVGSGFLLSLSSMVKAGISVPSAIRIIRTSANPYYKERLDSISTLMSDGTDIGTALKKGGHNFPDREAINDIRAYGGLKGFDESLQILAHEWLEESVTKVQAEANMAKGLATIIMGIIFSQIAGGIFSLMSQIGGGL